MTRFLSQALGAVEPAFAQRIAQLERAAGRPSADIRLTEDVKVRMRSKLAELALDPDETTGEELFEALRQRMVQDDAMLRHGLDIAEGVPGMQVVQRVAGLARQAHLPKAFVLKNSVAKKLLKNKPPKATMKRLGYRSFDSMLKHERTAQILAAARLAEPLSWSRTFRQQYTNLTPADFESRKIEILSPSAKNWPALGRHYASQARTNIMSVGELGAVLLLPTEERRDGLAVTMLLLLLEEVNMLAAYGVWVKLNQVKPGFGKVVQLAADRGAPDANWRMIQRHLARNPQAFDLEIFEPHIQPEDLHWSHAEDVLAGLMPELKFWQGTQALGLLGTDGEFVSCNALDTALSLTNRLSFGERVVKFGRNHIWHELMVRYLNQDNLNRAIERLIGNEQSEDRGLAGG